MLESVALETLREAHAFAAEHQRLLLADAVAIQEIDSKGKAVGEPFPQRDNAQMDPRHDAEGRRDERAGIASPG